MPHLAARNDILDRIQILQFRRDWIAMQIKSGNVTVELSVYAYENGRELDRLIAMLDEVD